MSERVTAKSEILRVLGAAGRPLAVHELGAMIQGYSENALATRISELHGEGKIVGRVRSGQTYKEWRLATEAERQQVLSQRLADRRRGERRTAEGPAHRVVGIQPHAVPDGYETALVVVPIGMLQPGQEVRFA